MLLSELLAPYTYDTVHFSCVNGDALIFTISGRQGTVRVAVAPVPGLYLARDMGLEPFLHEVSRLGAVISVTGEDGETTYFS